MTADCTWCGRTLDPGDCWLLAEPAGDRGAAFCRLEHVVPWAIRGPGWEPGAPAVPAAPDRCSHCSGPLPDTRLVLVRRRGGHVLPNAFCSMDHLSAWARAGGPWG